MSKDAPLHLPAGQHPCPRQQEDAGMALGEPYEGMDGGGLASQLTCLQPF